MVDARSEVTYVSSNELQELALKHLQNAGVRKEIAEHPTRGLVWTSLRGIDSHGIRLLPHYLAGVKGGRINPDPDMTFEQTASATGLVDADHTFGHAHLSGSDPIPKLVRPRSPNS